VRFLNAGPPPLAEYLCACALGQLFAVSEDIDFDLAPNDIENSIGIVFQCSQRYPTDRIVASVAAFVRLFASQFSGFAESVVGSILGLLEQYMTDESPDAKRSAEGFANSIAALCQYIQTPALFDSILNEVLRLAEEYPMFCEELITIVNGCASHAPELTPAVLSIAELLVNLFENEGREEAVQIARILKGFALRFGPDVAEAVLPAVFAIMQSIITSDLQLSEDDEPAVTTLARIAFVLYRQADAVADWMEALNECNIGGLAAAVVQCNPIVALQSQTLFESWLNCDSPIAFLGAAVSVLSAWDFAPETVQAQREEVIERVRSQLENLAGIDIESETDVEFFKVDEITAFFRSFS
jgi:hypothetical protein